MATAPATWRIAVRAAREAAGLRRHDALDVLDHDDRIVDHDADREHEPEQRKHVDRHPEREQAEERADDAHRNREHRDQRRAPALQEQEHDERHEHHRFHQRDRDLLDRSGHERRRVERQRSTSHRAGNRLHLVQPVTTACFTASAFAPGRM